MDELALEASLPCNKPIQLAPIADPLDMLMQQRCIATGFLYLTVLVLTAGRCSLQLAEGD